MDHEIKMNAVGGKLERTQNGQRCFDVTLHASDDELVTFTAVVPTPDTGKSFIDTGIEQDSVDALSRQLLGKVEDHHAMLHSVLSMMGSPMLAWSSVCPLGGVWKASDLPWQNPHMGYFHQLLEVLATSCEISNIPTSDLTSLFQRDAFASVHSHLAG